MIGHVARHVFRKNGRPLGSARIFDNGLRCGGRRYNSLASVLPNTKVGDQIHGFTVKKTKDVPELHLRAVQLEHDTTGAEYLHVKRDDKNNVFAISFKTNPTDCTGLPHILEHVTLCGSQQYPVRDPFFKMMPRSLANFMNAFTSSDYTSYPFATTNPQDYRNLSSVYLDATLNPLLKRADFLQEGWRLGPEDARSTANDKNVNFKGVVYNEMKGQMSDASYLFYIRFREQILPSLYNAGGDPQKMTDLTYEQLVSFSRRHYHPSNAKIFSYGSLNLEDQLKHVDSVISGFQRIQPDEDIKVPINLMSGPVVVNTNGPLDPMRAADQQVKSSVSWLGCDVSDIVESFSISMISSLLMNGYGSPLYQGLIENSQGTNFSSNTGYDTSGKLGIFSIGLDGMNSNDAENLQKTVQDIIKAKAAEAFEKHKIDGYMHQLEIALKHKTNAFGMGLLEKTLPGWFNGVDPLNGLAWNDTIEAFKRRLDKGNYLEGLVEKYLLNDHCFHFTMTPSEAYNTKLEVDEEHRRQKTLKSEEANLGSLEAVFRKLGKQELELLQEQESAQSKNIDTLPTLTVSDIPLRGESKPVRSAKINHSDWLLRETSTNGITYFQAKQGFANLPADLRPFLPLFAESLMRLGTRNKSVGDLESEILLSTGGISISPFVRPDAISLDAFQEGFLLDGYALDRNVPAMLNLMKTLLLDIDFDNPHASAAIMELLESKVAGALDSVAETGHHFAVAAASAALTERGRVQEQLSGLLQIETIAQVLDNARSHSESLHHILEKLKLIQKIAISNSESLSLRTVCESDVVSTNQKHFERFLAQLPTDSPASTSFEPSQRSTSSVFSRATFFDLPFQVSYVGSCLQTAPYASPDKAPLMILGQLLTHNFMHPEVREKGGAYGASASASPISGLFTMSSYRDPNPRNTLATFKKAGIFACDRSWSSREIEESKLSIFQGIDAPTSVSSDGAKQFMYGITEEMDQEMRQRLLNVTRDDIYAVAKKYLVSIPSHQNAVCVLGGKKDWMNEAQGSFTVRTLKTSA